MNLNYNDLVHILKQIKIAENHVPGQPILDAQGNPLGNLVPYGLRTVSGQFNDLTDQYDGAAHTIMPRLLTPEFNAAEANPRTGQATSYTQVSGSVYDSQPRTISNLISDQSFSNAVAVQAALNLAGHSSGAAYTAALAAAEAAADATDAVQLLKVLVASATTAATAAQTALVVPQTAYLDYLANGGVEGEGPEFAAYSAAIDALTTAQTLVTERQGQLADAETVADTTSATATQQLTNLGVVVENNTVVIENVMPDLGDTAPYNSFLTLFGQFFDHGLDLVSKGGSGTVYVPLQPDDPLYVAGSPTNFMVLTRATNQPGPDRILGTADDIREHMNETTPWIDLNQVYTSHESHQVFLREYKLDANGKPVATGHMLEGEFGGPPTWLDIKTQALQMLGIELTDADVGRVPLVATDLYGNFIPGANGFAQIVTLVSAAVYDTNNVLLAPAVFGQVEGAPDAPVKAADAVPAGNAFLNDIAHNAAPVVIGGVLQADEDTDIGNAVPVDNRGNNLEYDNELLDKHFIVGDGRGNENIGLTAVHHVFHSEHNHRVEQIKEELLASNDIAFINEWLSADIETIPSDPSTLEWDGERLFQAARFSTEMVYQHLVFEEFARLVSPEVDPFVFSNTVEISGDIMAEFAHVVYRFGHSMLNETVDRIAADGQTVNNIGLIEAFLNPVEYTASGMDSAEAAGAIIRGMSRQVGNEIDEFLTEALRNNLVGLPLDLGALNIARGRETGVPSLNNARAQFYEQTQNTQLKPYDSWFDFALAIKTPASIVNFIAAYGTHAAITSATTMEAKRDAALALVTGVSSDANLLGLVADRVDYLNSTGAWATAETGLNNVDFWIGGLAEKKPPFGGLLGTTFNFVFEVQMEKLQAGDRFYYLSRTQGMNLLNELEGDSFAELVMRNTDLGNPNSTHLPSSLFLTPAYTLELNIDRQKGVDPTHENPILNAISPMVVRNDPATAGTDTNYLRFTGGDHVVLGGTEQNDTLIGGEGDDTLWGDGGNDFLEGGFGVDHLFGGAGNDILTDSANDAGAADVFHGEAGDDVISSGNGLDLIFAGDGSDFIYGGQDSKTITAGEGNDFVSGPTGGSMIAGNEGDDWLEGGVGSSGLDTLAGENSELFFNSPIIGHDVLNGRDGDTDYDAESGDDIMVQGVGIQRNNGMAGFDWAIHKGDAVAADSDLGIPIFVNQQANILRDRFDLTEGLSGWKFNDKLVGREVVIGAYDEAAAAAAQFDPTAPFQSYSNALTEAGVARIAGLDQLVSHLARETFTVAGKVETVVVLDEAAVQRDVDGNAVTMFDTAADMLLGGGGNDTLQGKGGNDIIDGDKWLNVRIRINDAAGNEIATADEMGGKVYDLSGQVMHGGRSLSSLMFDRTLTPGQLEIVREILDGDAGNTGIDVAVYSGARSEYTLNRTVDGKLIVEHTGGTATDGRDTLTNIELLRFTDGDFNGAGVNVLPTGEVLIIGDAVEDGLLIADTATISDLDGFQTAFAFQWFRNGVAIDGAIGETYTPGDLDVGQTLTVQVTYTDLLGTVETLTSAATAPIVNVNDIPTGAPTAVLAAGTEDVAYTVTAAELLAGFSDVDGDPLSVSGLTATDGSVVDNGDGSYTITPSLNFNGAVTLNYDVVDGNGGVLATSQSYSLAAVNDLPTGTASAVLAAGSEDVAYTVTAAELLAGFSDVDGDILSVAGLTATDGSVVANVDGSYTITPSLNFNGAVTLSYDVVDGNGGSVAATQSYSLAAVNDAPEGGVTINNTAPSLNQTLTASNTLTDADGLGAIGYQWEQSADGINWSAIGGATAATFTTTLAQASQQVRVVASYTDARGAAESVASTGTTAVFPFNVIAGTLAAELINGTTLPDQILGNGGNDTLNGGDGNDSIVGAAGNDWLNGQVGNDTMVGGAGNDAFVVNSLADVVVEAAGGGIDTVNAWVNGYTLADNVENLVLVLPSGLNGNGNALNNTITGNTQDNVIDGGLGNDTMIGGAGNDTYYANSTADVVTEAAAAGTDSVISSASYTLSGNVENLTLTGVAGLSGTGNGLDNVVTGNDGANLLLGVAGNDTLIGGGGNDTLSGGAGKDFLTGGAGNDMFDFDTPAQAGNGAAARDVITDFVQGEDRIDLSGIDADTTLLGLFGLVNNTFSSTIVQVGGPGAAFSANAQLHYYFDGGNTIIEGNVNGANGTAEFQIQVNGLYNFTSSDFVL